MVELKLKQALGLALILHELSANAAKYGSLSTPEGHLDVEWTVIEEGETEKVRLVWQESDGPEVSRPKKRGFGARLIERSCRFELRGAAELDFASEGFNAIIAPHAGPGARLSFGY